MTQGDDSDKALSEEVLVQALKSALARVDQIEANIAHLTGEHEVARREVQLLNELLAVRRGEATGGESHGAVSRQDERGAHSEARTHPTVSAVITELEKAHKPLHISELMRSLQEDGVTIPGSGQPANLISYLTRDPRIIRPSRGMYALAAWGVEQKAKVKPAARRRARGASRSATRRTE
jgi:hypothetical protein